MYGIGRETNAWNTFVTLECDRKQPFRYKKLCDIRSDGKVIDDYVPEPPPIEFPQRNYTGVAQRSTI